VVRTDLEANSDLERRWEKAYWLCMLVLMGFIFLPVTAYYMFAIDNFNTSKTDGPYVEKLLLVYLLLQWAWVVGVCLHMHFGMEVKTEASRAYRRQIFRFMLVFLALTVQQLVYSIAVIVFVGSPSLCSRPFQSISSATSYLNYFGQMFLEYMGFANAILWGVSGSCLRTCVNKQFSHGVEGRQSSKSTGLELPLIQNESMQTGSVCNPLQNITGAEVEIAANDLRIEESIGKVSTSKSTHYFCFASVLRMRFVSFSYVCAVCVCSFVRMFVFVLILACVRVLYAWPGWLWHSVQRYLPRQCCGSEAG
jgi:hypothetical protein